MFEEKTPTAQTVQEGDKLVVIRNENENLGDQPRLKIGSADGIIEEFLDSEDVDEFLIGILTDKDVSIEFESDVWSFSMPKIFDKFTFQDYTEFGSKYNPTFDEE